MIAAAAVAIAAIVCVASLVALRWILADRKAAREAAKVAPLGELERRIEQLEAKASAAAYRPR